MLTGKGYLSYSALNSYLDCGERFRLERVVQVPQQNSWWLVGGKAVHTATEVLDNHLVKNTGPIDTAEIWHAAWAAEVALVDDVGKLRAGGRATKANPNREDGAWWTVNGLAMVNDYYRWITTKLDEGWQWFNPTGALKLVPIELPVDYVLADVQIKGYIDRVMVNPNGELVVIDIKTGSHTPASSLQLAVYALGIKRMFGVMPSLGAYYMARKAELSQMMSLLHYNEELVGSWFSRGQRGIEEELFIPHVTSLCGTCSVAPYCVAVGGRETV